MCVCVCVIVIIYFNTLCNKLLMGNSFRFRLHLLLHSSGTIYAFKYRLYVD